MAGGGSIVNTASLAAKRGGPGIASSTWRPSSG
ncbi:MAG: hypothetical protein ACYC0C_03525 [Devosia sp.]